MYAPARQVFILYRCMLLPARSIRDAPVLKESQVVEMAQGKALMGLYSCIYRGVQHDGLHGINAVINGGAAP
jgi:hypothetical protein